MTIWVTYRTVSKKSSGLFEAFNDLCSQSPLLAIYIATHRPTWNTVYPKKGLLRLQGKDDMDTGEKNYSLSSYHGGYPYIK